MSSTNQSLKPRSKGPKHISAASIDTNASGLAESTISLGLSRFPEPPASIPSTPLRSEFGLSLTSSSPPQEATSRAPSTPSTRSNNHVPASKSTHAGDTPQSSSFSNILSPYDWHDGASSIDVDATEGRLLPTSFITSLLQENKGSSKRASGASAAFSSISEMTYPPNIVRPDTTATTAPHTAYKTPIAPSAWSQAGESSSKRVSGDSETLHSIQGYPSIIRKASISRDVLSASVVGVAPATLRSLSGSSSVQDNALQTSDRQASRKSSTTHGTKNEPPADYKLTHSAYSPALSSTAGTPHRFSRDTSRSNLQTRDSLHSNKSAAPSFVSRMSSLRRFWTRRKTKPLPPVPPLANIPTASESAHQKEGESTPLPDLVYRAGALRKLLEKEGRPHDSLQTYHVSDPLNHDIYEAEMRKLGYCDLRPSMPTTISPAPPLHSRSLSYQSITRNFLPRGRRRTYLIVSIFLLALVVAIGAGVGVSAKRKAQHHFNCPGNFTGVVCNLDATCVCTSTMRCNGLAQSLVNLVPVVNREFNSNFTLASTFNSVWLMQGNPTTSNCASQALLVDVGDGIDRQVYPNRTQWAQAALLWNAIQTQDMSSANQIRQFVQKIPWKSLAVVDGPTSNPVDGFSTTMSGFTFDFASQTVSEPPASFVTLGQPSNAQISKVSAVSQSTLDRMYGFAQASSAQRRIALKNYWTSVLLQRPEDLLVFKAALSVSPILLPFNASSGAITNLYSASPSSPFPPPLACYPNLSNNFRQGLNGIETGVFGLQPTTAPTQFNTSCYKDRPIYGVLDILQLRLPYIDSRTGVPNQAVILTRDASPRVVLYSGETLTGPLNGTVNLNTSQLNSLQYGTLSLSDHVILQYLSAIPDTRTTIALVQFVLNSASRVPVPPNSSSILLQSINSIPTLEVAVFGDVTASDITSSVSSFTTTSGSLFFGSNDGSALRNWTINVVSGAVAWTENATSPLVVRDSSLADNTISQTWNAISLAISNNISGIGLANITTTLMGTQDFTT